LGNAISCCGVDGVIFLDMTSICDFDTFLDEKYPHPVYWAAFTLVGEAE
jgi:CHAT domain-containing protein